MTGVDDQNRQEVVGSAEFYNDKAVFERQRKNPDTIRKNRKQAFVALKLCGNLPKDAKLVDFPCGPGHHSDYFLDSGYTDIIAMDGSKAHTDGLSKDPKYAFYPNKPTFKHALYTDLNDSNKTVPDESADAFFCFGESWGFMPTLRENTEHFQKMYDKVKPGGTLIIQGRYTPTTYELDQNGVPQLKENHSRNLKKGETLEQDGTTWFSKEDFQPVESYVTPEFAPDLEDRFRQLDICHYAGGSVKYDETNPPSTMKIANYMNPSVDAEGRPVDYPVVRAFAKKLGMTDVTFHADLDHHDVQKRQPYYICSMVIKKPSKEEVDAVQGRASERTHEVLGK